MQHAGPIAVAAALLLALAAGCSGHSGGPAASASAGGQPGKSCGMAATAARVPVLVVISSGTVTCDEALRVQNDYARKLREGAAPGNGGGGPVSVDGWVCQGYPTPDILRTGRASQCHRNSARFYAVLPTPSGPASP